MPLSSAPLSGAPLAASVEEGAGMSVDLAGDALVEASASGTLYPTYLTAAADSVASAAGNLAIALHLAAAGDTSANASGDLDVLAALGGAASALASASAAISTTLQLAGGGAGEVAGTADIELQTGLSGTASGTVASTGLLNLLANLAGAASTIASAAGTFDTQTSIAGAANTLASASGEMTQAIAVASAAIANSAATGSLALSKTITGSVTYAINIKTKAITTITNFDFERIVYAHGKTYGLKGGKLYRIDGDKDPDNTNIDTTLRFAPSNLGIETIQRLNKIYIISRNKASLKVTPIYDEANGIEYHSTAITQDGMVKHRVSVGKDNKWNTIGLQIENVNGEAVDIGGFELLTIQLSRRIH